MTEELKQLREALRRVKHEAASLADAQVIALEALTQRPAAQAGEVELAFDQGWRMAAEWANRDDLIPDMDSPHYANERSDRLASLPTQPAAQADSMGMPTSCGKPLCSPDEHHPLCKLHKPAAQATPDVPETDFGNKATPEPVGEAVAEVVWYDPQLDHFPRKDGHKIIDASMAFMDAAPLGTKLYTRPAPGVPDFASLLKIKEPDGCAENIEQADRQEARCNGWNDCRDEVLNILAAAQAKGQ